MDFRSKRRNQPKTIKRQDLRRRLKVEQLAARRVLAAITGTVFEDLDHSYRQEAGEQSLAERLVFLDVNENAIIDTGEPYALTTEVGGFSFAGLPDGQYQVRLYDGSTSQTQVTPVDATINGASLLVPDTSGIATNDSHVGLLIDGAVALGDYSNGSLQSVVIPNSPTAIQTLPNGNFLLVGGDGNSQSAWVADPIAKTATPIDLLDDGSSVVWSDLVLDADGKGLLLQEGPDSTSFVFRIDASNQEEGIIVTDRGKSYSSDVQLVASQSGGRSIVAEPGEWLVGSESQTGLQVSLWSNSTGTAITNVPTNLVDTSEVLDYDDASGLLALRTVQGGVSVYDTNADFALLSTVPDLDGPVAIDGQRGLLVAMSASESTLELIDAHDGQWVASVDVDVQDIGQVDSIQVQQSDSLVLLGAKGTSRLSLVKPAAHRVTLIGGNDSVPVKFGVETQGDNTVPVVTSVLSYETNEDESLFVPSSVGILTAVTDADEDRLVVLQIGTASNGAAVVTVDGDVHYTPSLNFNGSDSASLVVHDGRGASSKTPVLLDVVAVNDPPQIILEVDEIAENLEPDTVLGPVSIVDPDDGDENELEVTDERFEIRDGQLIYVGPGEINYEFEPFIDFEIYDTNYLTSESFRLEVQDENDPIMWIDPDYVDIVENAPGVFVDIVDVFDEDGSDGITVTVDDDRFIIEDFDLSLAPGVSLDYEAGATFTINLTATDKNGGSLTEPLEITVFDVVERPASIDLSNETVLEREPGAVVGDVIVDGNVMSDGYTATVDDARFEIVDSTLKLVDDQSVNLADQDEIELTIVVQDLNGVFDSLSETFVISVLENSTPHHNDSLPFDVDGSGVVSPGDALLIIDFISENGAGEIANVEPEFDLDVNGDGLVTPLDILLVLNELDAIRSAQRDDTVGREGPNGELPSSDLIAPSQPIAVNPDSEDETRRGDESGATLPQSPSQFRVLRANQFALTDSFLLDSPTDSLATDDDMSSEEFADGVDASLDSLLDEMS